MGRLGLSCNTDVIENTHAFEDICDLERSGDPTPGNSERRKIRNLLIFKKNFSFRRRHPSRDDIKKGRLPGTIRTDDGGGYPFVDVHTDILEHLQSTDI